MNTQSDSSEATIRELYDQLFAAWDIIGGIGDLARQLAEVQDDPNFAKAALAIAVKLLKAESGVFLRSQGAPLSAFRAESVVGEGVRDLLHSSWPITGILADVSGHPILLSRDELGDRSADPFIQVLQSPSSFVGVPMRVRTNVVGCLVFLNKKNQNGFSASDRDLAYTLGLIIALNLLSTLGRMLPKQIADIAVASPDRLEPRSQSVTVLFLDVRSFSPMVDKVRNEPSEWQIFFRQLGEFRDAMVAAARHHNGVVGTFAGDGFMVVFNAPVEQRDHVALAVRTAVDMQRRMEQLRQKWQDEGKQHWQWRIGIGIASGEVMAGQVSYIEPIEYSTIGHKVNLASRLTSEALGDEILIDESVRQQLPKNLKRLTRVLGRVRIRGLEGRETAWEVNWRQQRCGRKLATATPRQEALT